MGGSSRVEHTHAITDLYDTQRGTFLVPLPLWLILALGISGVIAVAMVGFLGYKGDPAIFDKPWELYLWLCALMITLLVTIFRHKSLRGYLIAMLVVALLWIVIVYLFQIPGGIIRRFFERYLPLLADAQLTYIVINFGVIAIFWVDNIRRWIRRSQGLRLHPEIDLTTGERMDDKADPADQPSMAELVSGDLLAGALLTAVLSYIFLPIVISHIVITSPPLGACNLAISFPPSDCQTPGVSFVTLNFLDQVQALGYATAGFLILGLAAMLGGFGSIGGARIPVGVAKAVNAVVAGGGPVVAPITTGVAETVVDALRAALNRRLRELMAGVGRSLRNIVWPILLFLATYGIYEVSINIQSYLHAQGLLHLNERVSGNALIYILFAAIWGLVSALSVAFSAALALFRWHVADNTLRFLGLIGFILALTFWIFSLGLWGFNILLEQFIDTIVRPFDPPSLATAGSFILLVIFGGYVLLTENGRQLVRLQSSTSRPTGGARRRAASTGTLARTPTAAPPAAPTNQPPSAQE